MLKATVAAALLAVALGGNAVPQSQEEPRQSRDQQHSAEPQPKQYPTENTGQPAAQDQKQGEHGRADEKHGDANSNKKRGFLSAAFHAIERAEKVINVFSTLGLAVFTALLFVATLILASYTDDLRRYAEEQANDMKGAIREAARSADAAKLSADAAKQSADATLELERPFLFLVAKPKSLIAKGGTDTPAEVFIDVNFTNLGRVPMVVRAVYTECFVAGELSPTSPISKAKLKRALSAVAAGQTLEKSVACRVEPNLTRENWADLRADKKGIVLFAIVLYEGALNFTYLSAVAYKVDPFSGDSYPVGGTDRNYDDRQSGRFSAGVDVKLRNIVP